MTTPDYEAMAIAQVAEQMSSSTDFVRLNWVGGTARNPISLAVRSTMEALRLKDELASVRKATIEQCARKMESEGQPGYAAELRALAEGGSQP